MDIENINELIIFIIETYGILIILPFIIKIIYFILLYYKVSKNKKHTKNCEMILKQIKENQQKNNELNLAYLKQFTTQFERIAKALEEETEPYIIENNDNEFSDNRSSTGNP